MVFIISSGLVLVALGAWLIYTYFLSPLASIPNAGFLAPVSRLLWEFPVEYQGRITLELPKLHKRLGPLVRIGPNQVSFYSLDIYKKVHAPNSPFAKDPRVYSQFVQDGHPALFSITDPKEHAQRRRHMGIVFNRSKVPALTDMMVGTIDSWVKYLASVSAKGPVDLGPTCRALESDIVSKFAFGNAIGAVKSLHLGKEVAVIKENDIKSSKMPVYTNFPILVGLWHYLADWIFKVTGLVLSSVTSSQQFDQWADSQLLAVKDTEKAPSLSFLKVMSEERIPEQSALSEAKEMLGPGTDTTSATLAHILYALSLNQTFQEDLVSDLQAAGWSVDMSALESIPRLVASVKEGIRWTGAAAAMLPRIVPQGGYLLAGKHLPGGTMISSSPIWYLRDETAFPDPERYRPSRWLVQENTEATSLRDDYYVPFSKGASTCVGIHFAYLELFLSLSQLLKRYSIHPVKSSRVTALDHEAILPPRREWVAAVPIDRLEVMLLER
ncbi:benzoate 4-monooxygenase cytochrome p450 [Aspergillus heteromorphus CBS 117.55]|uniref:Benzoate 4-monooxygenase cytochrome p450 n=1 Tax=Aspergillus heteromorphus CBS 117.55 TaxID=1448321 RepID=A0A317WH99_9EURO|nr:benzoate 4-monooxygenase cytochrome p450 [Aspergillus heteromorphus CBS 117.55]PWY83570.1 benzoate 4-monooxygenase cytochrome p450 [Aspergillus heteromorphus CBS 117.55]